MALPSIPAPPRGSAAALVAAVAEIAEELLLAPGDSRMFDDPDRVWWLASGGLDLFAARTRGGRQAGPREHLGELAPGALVWGIDQAAEIDGLHLVVQAREPTRLFGLDSAQVARLQGAESGRALLARGVDGWIRALSSGVAKHLAPRRQPTGALSPGERRELENEERIRGCRQGVVWVAVTGGVARYADVTEVAAADPPPLIPLTAATWIEGRDGCRLTGYDGAEMFARGGPAPHLVQFHRWVFHSLAYGLRNAVLSERERLSQREIEVEAATTRTFSSLAGLLGAPSAPVAGADGDDALFECCRMVVALQGGTAVLPPWRRRRRRGSDDSLSAEDVARASHLRLRQVLLRGEWWRDDAGPLVARRAEGGGPVALLPWRRGYRLHDPVSGKSVPVTAAVAHTLSPTAHLFYRALPHRPLGAFDLIRFGLGSCRGDLVILLLSGLLGGLIGLTVPFAAGVLFDSVIPEHQTRQMFEIALALAAVTVGAVVFRLTGDIAQIRIEGRVGATLQAALMDRLLRLPNRFFADYSAGDLAQRGMAVETIRNHLSGAIVASLLSGGFSLVNLILLGWYSPLAALLGLGVLLTTAALVGGVGVRLRRVMLEAERKRGAVQGLVLALVTGIVKLRVAGAEARAFNVWGGRFTAMRAALLRGYRLVNLFNVVWVALEGAALAAVFLVITPAVGATLSTGGELAVLSAFSSLLAAIGALGHAAIELQLVAPVYRRARPILDARPETDLSKADPGILSGGFEVSGVRFRYGPDTPPVLRGVSIQAEPGEFIALVGASGSGKSTLIRLLLGFDHPEAGGVFYDGHDLRGLDLQRLRAQIGVVLQGGKLMSGSLYENVRGASQASLDTCWEAVRQVGLADEVEAMPMGIHTVITEGAAALSGGQIQRLLLARAIVGKPRLLLLDEATSALDNRTQALVTESLDRLLMTRVVVAHRLSTIIGAQRIYVFDQGEIVETGRYDDLFAAGGRFTRLVERQRTSG